MTSEFYTNFFGAKIGCRNKGFIYTFWESNTSSLEEHLTIHHTQVPNQVQRSLPKGRRKKDAQLESQTSVATP